MAFNKETMVNMIISTSTDGFMENYKRCKEIEPDLLNISIRYYIDNLLTHLELHGTIQTNYFDDNERKAMVDAIINKMHDFAVSINK